MKSEKFIEKARKIHGSKYDYSKIKYSGCYEKICIICPVHGEFWQTPSNHLQGCGCPKCGKEKSTTMYSNEEFIEKAKKVHGDKYDYSKVEYKGWNKKVCIICPIHGEFWQQSNDHIARGRGCPQCSIDLNKKRSLSQGELTFKKWVDSDKNIYCIDVSQYQGWNNNINATCKKHGDFVTTPKKLKYGKIPCPYCREEKKHPKKDKQIYDYGKIFISKLELKYPNRFLYDKMTYINNNCEVELYDKNFEIYVKLKPLALLKQKIEHIPCYRTLYFIEKAKKVHGDKYDYSKVEYVDSKTKVCIICNEFDKNNRKHGEFWQTPNEHLKGSGCSKCANNIKWGVNDYINEARKIHGDKYDYSKMELKKQNEHITLICPEHGEFQVRAMHHLKGSGCPICKGSGGEIALLNFFKNKNLNFVYNKFYKWLNNYQLDFYFPEYKLAVEVQGQQHFRETKYFQTNLETQIKRDKEKKELCEKNGVVLLYYAPLKRKYPYKVFTDINELYTVMKDYIKI